jgi:predicted RNA-binding protein YlqC (UPF0109 family)
VVIEEAGQAQRISSWSAMGIFAAFARIISSLFVITGRECGIHYVDVQHKNELPQLNLIFDELGLYLRRGDAMTEAQAKSVDTKVDGTRGLLERVLLALVTVPEAASIQTSTAGDATVFSVRVAPVDVSRVIGEGGRTVRALRMILGAVGLRHKHRFILEIEEHPE